MGELVEKIRAARERWVTVAGREYLFRRPTKWQLREWKSLAWPELLGRVVVGWRGVRVVDLVPDGTVAEAPFEADAFVEWLEDQPDLLAALIESFNEILAAAFASAEADEKN